MSFFNLKQMIWTAKMAGTTVNWGYGCEVMISYLPLSHVAAQVVDIFVPLVYGASIYFAQPDALKVDDLAHSLSLF